MKYWQAKKLPSTKFKRLTGVKKTFRVMVRTVKAKEKEKKKPGRKPKLIIEDQILMSLQYLREYRTYYHIAKDWKILVNGKGRTQYCSVRLKNGLTREM